MKNDFTDKPIVRGYIKELRVSRVSPMMHEDIKNIAGHLGIPINDFLKVELLHIIGKHPEHYRKPLEK